MAKKFVKITNNTKIAALYLYHNKGRSLRYIAKKFNVTHRTVGSWVVNEDKIKAKNNKDLGLLMFNFILRSKSIDWFGEE